MRSRIVTSALQKTVNELFDELAAGALNPGVQIQIRDGLAETLAKGVVASIMNLKGSKYISQIGAQCSDSSELIERLVARDQEVAERALGALKAVREEILREISDRLAAAVEAGVA